MNKKNILVLLVSLLLLISIRSQLLAIDFGTQFIKASIVHSGAGKSFSIVENSKSQRKFLNALGFYNEERFYQNDALPKRTKLPQNCFLYSRLLIDLVKNPSLISMVKKDLFLQYINENTQDQFLAEFILKQFPQQTSQVTLLEVVTMILKYVKTQAQKYAKSPIKDVIFVLPNYWTIHQRTFLLQAAAVADIYILSIISENTAAAINYALSQRNNNKTENVLFYNLGSNALQMTLVEYRQVPTEKSPKGVESIFVLDDYGKPYVGGLRFDSIICKYFAQIFQQKYKKPLNRRGLIKLLEQSNEVKETLSANKQATIFVEGIMDGIDFSAKITRAQFQKRCEQIFKQLTSPLKRFLLDNDLKADDLHAVELIGGGTRIPKLQSMIVQILDNQKQKVGTHINGDQSMALGGAFFAANSSKKFKVKGINLYDGFNFEMRLVLRNLDQSIQQGDQNYFYKNATIFKKKSRYGLNKQVNFKCSRNLIADIYKVDQQGNEQLIKSYEFDQIQSFNETDFKLSLTFSIDPLEVVVLKDSKFTYKKDEITTYLQKVKVPKQKKKTSEQTQASQQEQTEQQQGQNVDQKQIDTEAQSQDQQKTQEQENANQQQTEEQKEATGQSAEQSEQVNEQQEQNQSQKQQKQQQQPSQTDKKTRKNKRPLKKSKKQKEQQFDYETVSKNKTVTKKYQKALRTKQTFSVRKQQQNLGQKSKKMLKTYQAAQQRKRALAQARNKLEALIYEVKDKVQNEDFIKYSKESQRQHLSKLAEEKEQWHDQSTSKNPIDYKQHYNELHKPTERIKKRIIEHYERQHIRDRALQTIQQYRKLTQKIQKGKEWITDEQVQDLQEAISESEKKIKDIYNSMEQTEINEDTIYKNKDMVKQAEVAKDKYFALKAKVKPKKQEKQKNSTEDDQSKQQSNQQKKSGDVNQDEL